MMHARFETYGVVKISLTFLVISAAVLWLYDRNTTDDLPPINSYAKKTPDRNPPAHSMLKDSSDQNTSYDNLHNTNVLADETAAPSIESTDEDLIPSVDSLFDRSMADLKQCIANLGLAEHARLELAIYNLWVVAADLKAPEEALNALEVFISKQTDMKLIDLAEFALSDLHHLIEMNHTIYLETAALHPGDDEAERDGFDHDGMHDSESASDHLHEESNFISNRFHERISELNDQALFNPEPDHRKDAIHALSNVRDEATVDVLLSAANDPDPTNRYLALQALWFTAADDINDMDVVLHYLQQAQNDSDSHVAEVAESALMDLEHIDSDVLPDQN